MKRGAERGMNNHELALPRLPSRGLIEARADRSGIVTDPDATLPRLPSRGLIEAMVLLCSPTSL